MKQFKIKVTLINNLMTPVAVTKSEQGSIQNVLLNN